MKHKTSVALKEDTLTSMRASIRKGKFRNKSHMMEYAILKLLEEDKSKEEEDD